MTTIEKLLNAMQARDSLVCVGLDPDYGKIPSVIPTWWGAGEERVMHFLQDVVHITAPYVCSYKVQKAFFDSWDNGHELLRLTIGYVHSHYPAIPVFLDCKIGDIDNTMGAHMANIFDNLGADGVLLNPYMGDDVFAPMAQYPEKAGVVLVKTSNHGASIVQDYCDLWKHILHQVVDRWNVANNLIPVITSTANIDLAEVRAIIPDQMPILLAGFGAQGGSVDQLRLLLNSKSIGVFVNSSRGIIYPYCTNNADWRQAIESSVAKMKSRLNEQRR